VILPFDLPAVDGEPPCRQSRYEAWLTGTAKSGEPHEMLGLAASGERWFHPFRPDGLLQNESPRVVSVLTCVFR